MFQKSANHFVDSAQRNKPFTSQRFAHLTLIAAWLWLLVGQWRSQRLALFHVA
jgi:hypothetical protein